jgi:hypothetical protein
MHIQNIVETKKKITRQFRGDALNTLIAKSYPGICLDCSKEICSCPPILTKTIGRIGHEVPDNYDKNGHFMTVEKTSQTFSE